MPVAFDTKSERLFAAICEREGHAVEKLPESRAPGVKAVDLRITTAHGVVYAEVKELRANDDDRKSAEDLRTKHFSNPPAVIIGARARTLIVNAAKQLKTKSRERCPCIAVLYNNLRADGAGSFVPMEYLELFHIDAAMFGAWVTHLRIGAAGVTPKPSHLPDRNGPGRTTTAEEKRYIAAVAIISDGDDETVVFYHNTFAEVPLPPEWFRHEKCIHLVKPGDPHATPHAWSRLPVAPNL